MKQLVILRRQCGGPGGAERVAKRFADLFDSEGWQISLWHAGKQVADGTRLGGVHGPNWWQVLTYASSVDRAAARARPDLVLSLERGPRCHVFRAGDGVHARWLELSCKPLVSRVFNPFHHVAPIMERRSVQSACVIVPNSMMVGKEIASHHPGLTARIQVIHNGFDGRRFFPLETRRAELRSKLGLPGHNLLLLFAGSGWQRKGLSLAIEILARSAPDAHLCVLGKGRRAEYENQIRRLGLRDRVCFHGVRENIAEYYQAADVFVLPTLYDPFSNACLEALACGTPVITTLTNGAAEVIMEGRTGCLIDARSPDLSKVECFLQNLTRDSVAVAQTVSTKEHQFEREAYRHVFQEALNLKSAR